MKRRLFNILAAASLAMFVAICALWLASSRAGHFLSVFWFPRQPGTINYLCVASGNNLWVVCAPQEVLRAMGAEDEAVTLAPGIKYATWPPSTHTTAAYISFTYRTIATAILPAMFGWRFACRRRNVNVGVCRWCGYDLRATPGRCPECGTPTSPIPAAK